MNKNTDIYSVEYYLRDVSEAARKPVLSKLTQQKKNFKILVQDHVKDSVYLIDA